MRKFFILELNLEHKRIYTAIIVNIKKKTGKKVNKRGRSKERQE